LYGESSIRTAEAASTPAWRPLRAFDDGERVYIQFPPGIAQGELPPIFVIGAVMLIDTDVPAFGVPYWLIGSLAVLSASFIFLVGGVALRARRRPVVTGHEELIGSVGVVLEDTGTDGWARVRSEQWQVHSPVPLKRGQGIRVTARNGLVLTVMPLNESAGG